MSLSKFKTSETFKAVRKFTDREKAQQVFWNAVDDFRKSHKPLQILTYYGIGGIGKTRLLQHLLADLNKRIEGSLDHKLRKVFISLDAYKFKSAAEVLLSIRNKLEIPCHLFDYALIKHWSTEGTSILDIQKRGIHEDSIIWDILDYVGDIGGVLLPFKLVKKGFEFVKDKVIRNVGDLTLALHKSRLMAISRSFQSRQVMQQFLLDRLIG